MRGLICHTTSLHPLSIPSIPTQNNMKKYQNVDTHRHLYIKINREMRRKCRCDMAHHSHKMNDVEKMFWEDTEVYVLQKMILDHNNEISPHRQRELICHAMSLHP